MNKQRGILMTNRQRGLNLFASLNPGFETAGSGGADVFGSWFETAGTGAIARTTTAGEFYAGTAAAKLTAGSSANTLIKRSGITVVPGTAYRLQFWARGDGTNQGRYYIYNSTGGSFIQATVETGVTGTTYVRITKNFTAPALCVSIELGLFCPSVDTGIAYFDDVDLFTP